MQCGQVIQHRSQPPTGGRVRVAGITHTATVISGDDPFQAPLHGRDRRGPHPDLGQHPQRVELRCGLDDPSQHQRLERVVAELVEPELVIHPGQRVPQQQRSRPLDQRLKPGRPGRARVRLQLPRELLLPGMQTSTGHLDQNRKISLGMRRSDVLDPQHPPTPLVHDLHRGRARGSRHPTHECPHQARLPTPRHPISATQKTKTPNHSHQNRPNGHREPTQA